MKKLSLLLIFTIASAQAREARKLTDKSSYAKALADRTKKVVIGIAAGIGSALLIAGTVYRYKKRAQDGGYTTLNEPFLPNSKNPLELNSDSTLEKSNPLIELIESGNYQPNPEIQIGTLVKEGADQNAFVLDKNNEEIPLLHLMLQMRAPDNAIRALVKHGAMVGPTTLTYVTNTTDNELQAFLMENIQSIIVIPYRHTEGQDS